MNEPRRKFRYTLGSIMAFIAGMAVMLGILLPFVRPVTPTPTALGAGHPGPITATTAAARQQCLACHGSGLK